MSVCVFFGSGKINENEEQYKIAMELSELVASLGYDVASGGYGGVMEAVLKGAAEYNVKRIGVTCDLYLDRIANDFMTDEIKTKDYFERLEILIDIGDLFIALSGGSGTLLEVSAVVALIERKFIENRYFVLFGENWHNLECFMQINNDSGFIKHTSNFKTAIEMIKKINLN
jgi:uncharacterized protein (TIGR00725 family)